MLYIGSTSIRLVILRIICVKTDFLFSLSLLEFSVSYEPHMFILL